MIICEESSVCDNDWQKAFRTERNSEWIFDTHDTKVVSLPSKTLRVQPQSNAQDNRRKIARLRNTKRQIRTWLRVLHSNSKERACPWSRNRSNPSIHKSNSDDDTKSTSSNLSRPTYQNPEQKLCSLCESWDPSLLDNDEEIVVWKDQPHFQSTTQDPTPRDREFPMHECSHLSNSRQVGSELRARMSSQNLVAWYHVDISTTIPKSFSCPISVSRTDIEVDPPRIYTWTWSSFQTTTAHQ